MDLRKLILLGIALLCLQGSYAQSKVDAHAQVKTMHYWRGLRVTDGVMTGVSAGYFGENLSAFVWGGLSFDGEYTEVTNVISYKYEKFNATLTDIYNFSNIDTVKYFNYKDGENDHLVDLTLGYSFSFLEISMSTILYGADLTIDGDQRFSSYLLLKAPIKFNDITFAPYIAPAFALNGKAKDMLYGDEAFGIADVGFEVKKDLKIKEKILPVSAVVGYNTILNQASVQLAVDLF